jgi:hypothetical protein
MEGARLWTLILKLEVRIRHVLLVPLSEFNYCFVDDQTFSLSHDLAPRPPPPPFPCSKLSLFLSLRVCVAGSSLLSERGSRCMGEEPNQTTARKPGPR